VNRLTLRAALARLEALGLIATRHGAGTEVTSWRERAGLDSLAALIGTTKPSDPAWYEMAVSLLELRRILATEAVALAAERHTPEHLAIITKAAEEQSSRTHDALEYARGEIAFERAIIRATGNVAFELVLNMFARFPDDRPEVVEALYDQRDHAALFYGVVIELIRGRDAAKARERMGELFAAIDADWMARHAPRAARAEALPEPTSPAPTKSLATKSKTRTKTKTASRSKSRKTSKRRDER
jgi:DNA-binding FadR family transcriptional regulator